MLGEKKNSTPLANKFQGTEPVYMLPILDTSVKILGKLEAVLETYKNSTWGAGWDKVRLA